MIWRTRRQPQANAMEEAKAYFDQAMEYMDLLPDTAANREQRLSLLVNQSAVFQLLFKHPEYHALLKRYEDLVIELPNSELAGVFYARLAQCECAFGNFRQAIQVGGEAARLCEREGESGKCGVCLLHAGGCKSMVRGSLSGPCAEARCTSNDGEAVQPPLLCLRIRIRRMGQSTHGSMEIGTRRCEKKRCEQRRKHPTKA